MNFSLMLCLDGFCRVLLSAFMAAFASFGLPSWLLSACAVMFSSRGSAVGHRWDPLLVLAREDSQGASSEFMEDSQAASAECTSA